MDQSKHYIIGDVVEIQITGTIGNKIGKITDFGVRDNLPHIQVDGWPILKGEDYIIKRKLTINDGNKIKEGVELHPLAFGDELFRNKILPPLMNIPGFIYSYRIETEELVWTEVPTNTQLEIPEHNTQTTS